MGTVASPHVPARRRPDGSDRWRPVLVALGWVGGLAVVAFAVLPLWYLVVLSLAPDPAGAGLWPRRITLDNFRLLASPAFAFSPALQRSVLLSAGTTAVSLVIAVPAAYALARLPVPGRDRLLAATIALPFFPGVLLLVPLRTGSARLGWFDHLPTIGLAQLSFTLPLALFFLAYAFRQVPDEVLEAAVLDGAGTPHRILRIVLPMSAPGVAATTALVFVWSWNDFLFSSGLSQSPRSETLPVALAKLPVLGFLGGQMAAAVLMCVPAGLVLFALQRWAGRRAG
jgi:ABC-type glycerol-3-phosphate transport system permease component